MATGAELNTAAVDTSIRVAAGGSVSLGTIDADLGDVSISGTTITDSGLGETDVVASNLRLDATAVTGGIGTGANAVDVLVVTVSARSGTGGIYLSEMTGVAVDTTPVISVN